MNRKHFTFGGLFGLLAPLLGLFAGLQVTPFLGNVLMFPFIIVGKILGQPLGEFSPIVTIICFIASIVAWGLIFAAIGALIQRRNN